MATLIDLISVAEPPIDPVGTGSPLEWASVERQLRIEFPPDYKAVVSTYGDGLFNGFEYLFNPFRSDIYGDYFRQIELVLEAYRIGREEVPIGSPPFPAFPVSDGVFPAFRTENGDVGYWIIHGPPSGWKLLLGESRTIDMFEIYDMDVTTFLTEHISGRLRSVIFGSHNRLDRGEAFRRSMM